jgi:hypothetical protein
MKKLARYTIPEITAATKWVHVHFAELDLGGNMRWLSALHTVLSQLSNGSWNTETERLVFNEYLQHTRWYLK